ncbi:SH3 domain-containing protein 19 [Lingula anatina]|uniref:SH3 domain-containing protein 19 n=1 Tax=Lingula anatina TaxID=7574 RepID=A0A1S3HMJ9_LINAN|nr:SH3 domain-containing protein 19 [Lingula anatina]|eukprot:XP_013387298.1 SH3 domain-containing protein 19 [Lingula anatina]
MAEEGGSVNSAPLPPKRPTIIRYGNTEGLENGTAVAPPIPARAAPPPPVPRPSKDSGVPPPLPPSPKPLIGDGPPPLPPGPRPVTDAGGGPPPLPPGPKPITDAGGPPPLQPGTRPVSEMVGPPRPIPPKPGPPQRPVGTPQVPTKPSPPSVAPKNAGVSSSSSFSKPPPAVPVKSSKHGGSVKKRPEITIVAARPMSEVGFRESENVTPEVPSSISLKPASPTPPFNNRSSEEGEPPPPNNDVQRSNPAISGKPARPTPVSRPKSCHPGLEGHAGSSASQISTKSFWKDPAEGDCGFPKREPPSKPSKPPPRPVSLQGGAPLEGRGPPPPIPASRTKNMTTPQAEEEPAPPPPKRSTSLKKQSNDMQQGEPVEELISFEETLSTEEQPPPKLPGRPTIISRPKVKKEVATEAVVSDLGGSERGDSGTRKPPPSVLPPKPKPKPQPKPIKTETSTQNKFEEPENMGNIVDKNLTELGAHSAKPSVAKRPTVIRSLPKSSMDNGAKQEDSLASPLKLTDFDPLATKAYSNVSKLKEDIKTTEPAKPVEIKPPKPSFRPTIIPKSNSGLFKGSKENISNNSDNLPKQQAVETNQTSGVDLLTDDIHLTEGEVAGKNKKISPSRPSAPPAAMPSVQSNTAVRNLMDADITVDEKKSSPPGRPKSMPPPRPSANPPPRPAVAAPSKHSPPKSTKLTGAKPKTAGTSEPPPLPTRPGPGHPLFHYVVEGPHGIAAYDYDSSQPDELSFKSGDVIVLLRRVDADWLFGRNGVKEGMFPQGFVDIVEPLQEELWEEEAPEKPDLLTGPRCRARFDFDGEGEDDLNFEDGDVIGLLERVGDEWLRGCLNGKVGVFPLSFVEIIEDLPLSPPETGIAGREGDTGSVAVTAHAMYDFDGQDGELSFKAGDQIKVLSQVNTDWLYGELNGHSGSFPAGFVDHVPPGLPPFQEAKQSTNNKENVPTQKGPSSCVALHSFTAEAAGELTIMEGDKIIITEHVGDGWLKGKLGGKEGIFPEAFVKISNDEQGTKPSSSSEYAPKARALHDFEGQGDNELSFKSGDVIYLLEKINEDWYSGELGNKVGQFPVNFVDILVALP